MIRNAYFYRTDRLARTLALLMFTLAFACLGSQALAQRPGGGGQQGGGQRPYGGQANGSPSGMNPGNSPPPGSRNGEGPGSSTVRGGLQLGPAGRWWNDDDFARSLGLDKGQQHRMDDVFKANKGDLIKLYKSLQHEESRLEKVSRAKVLDEAEIDSQIDRVVQARGDLEKADAHMLLAIRKEMSPEQISRLDEHRPSSSSDGN